MDKIFKHKNYIMAKSGLSEKEFDKLLAILFKYIKIVYREEIGKNWAEAKKTMAHIDKEDAVFIAAALSIRDSVIWSDDRHFEKQNVIRVLKTKDVV